MDPDEFAEPDNEDERPHFVLEVHDSVLGQSTDD